MRIAIPTLDDKGLQSAISPHFGHAEFFSVVEKDTNGEWKAVEPIPNTSNHKGGEGQPPELMNKKDVNIMICSGIGGRAVDMFSEFDIIVYKGADGTVEDIMKTYDDGLLERATPENACDSHGH